MLYLDNSATTSILPEVKDKMLTYLTTEFGNPSGKYYSLAETADAAINEARTHVSKLFNSKEIEVIFTSGATESNNMVLKGVADRYSDKGNHIITSKTEHKAVLDVCEYLETKGYEVTYLDVDQYGRVNPEELSQAITSNTILVSIIWGNNELGSLNDIETLSNICKENNVFFHTDATQVAGKIEIDWDSFPGVSFLSCSAHKMHGPKGVGAVLIRSDQYGKLISLTPLLHGGGQEKNIRSGTYSVHNIVGFGEAARIAEEKLVGNHAHLEELEQILKNTLASKFKDNISFNSDDKNKIPGIVNVRFIGLNNEILLKKLSPIIAASTGSSCSSTKPSYVLQAIGLDIKSVRESVRFSLSPYTSIKELGILDEL
ncbi:cysteine desulfurase family protein [Sediminibacillus massiliensis]|uniref:cysteine desulfurase family protein n=1 Tax=Sediminibacillus massiliensis TaxID=1926277 RepID=UPI00098859B2|nr:cysteine desulfurase family protein [Sediminibacillus massiliensis]